MGGVRSELLTAETKTGQEWTQAYTCNASQVQRSAARAGASSANLWITIQRCAC